MGVGRASFRKFQRGHGKSDIWVAGWRAHCGAGWRAHCGAAEGLGGGCLVGPSREGVEQTF
jgi:hypothetical protein